MESLYEIFEWKEIDLYKIEDSAQTSIVKVSWIQLKNNHYLFGIEIITLFTNVPSEN